MPDLPGTQAGTESGGQKQSDKNELLLKKIREDFRYCKSYWRENHEESEKDMRFMAAIPPTDFTDDRKNRPVIWPDEISQYVKQANNNLRQNKRSIKISPRTDGATAQDAEHRQAYIRGIEYASNAQSIYTTAFEACVACAMGFGRLTTCITGPKGEQEPRFRRIPNQFTCYPDPDAQEADFSDSCIYFVLDSMRESTFKRRYPKAKKRSFSPEDRTTAPDWFNGQNLVVAEYWTREEHGREDEEKTYTVTQYITNGLEILETNPWIGSWIPIVGMFGEEIYVRTGGESKRMFLSLIRRARPAQQMLAYIASQEAEEFQMAPRAPLMAWKGMLNVDTDKLMHAVPKAWIDVSVPKDWNTAWGAPQMPTRPQFTPNIEAYEAAYERWRRSLQAAMGIAPLPTPAQAQNQKSGIALERISTQEAIGAFHFTDNFSRFLQNYGRQTNELITILAKNEWLPDELLGKDQKDEDMNLKVAPKGSEAPPNPQNLSPQAQAILSQSQGQIQMLTQELQKLQLEKLGKKMELDGKANLAAMDHASAMTEADKDRETKLAIAEVMTKAQSISERMTAVEDLMKQFHDQAHEFAMAAQNHSNAKELQAQATQADQQSQQSDQVHEAAQAQQAQAAAAQQPQGENQ